jgi:hypothetical protein
MLPRDWIKRWLKEHPDYNQRRLALAAGIEPAKLSDIMTGKNKGTPLYMAPLSRIMGISLDSIYDEAARWPGKKLEGQGQFLTDAEKRVLEVAHYWSEGDDTLKSAIDRMNGKPSAFLLAPAGEADRDLSRDADEPKTVRSASGRPTEADRKAAGRAARNGTRGR